jgi:hypothetical protein
MYITTQDPNEIILEQTQPSRVSTPYVAGKDCIRGHQVLQTMYSTDRRLDFARLDYLLYGLRHVFFVTKLFQMTRLLSLSLGGGTSGADREVIELLLRRCVFRASTWLLHMVMAGESERRRSRGGSWLEVEGNVGSERYPQLFSA